MSKRHAELTRVLEAIFQDCSQAIPAIRSELERDLLKLRTFVVNRGIRFITVDLANLAKSLHRGLASGTYKLEGLPGQAPVSSRVQIPKFLRGLYLRIFDEGGCLLDDPDIEAIFFLRQILLFGKKYQHDVSKSLERKALKDFKDIELGLASYELYSPATSLYGNFNNFVKGASSEDTLDELQYAVRIVGIIFDDLSCTLGHYDPEHWTSKHGPGVCSDSGRFEDKYVFKHWTQRLETFYYFADHAFHNWSAWASEAAGRDDSYEVLPSRIYIVPKSATSARTICAEPAGNMWCQQNLLSFFVSRTAKSWIGRYLSFNDQVPNQIMAQAGSRTSSLSTVDLSSASDRVTCGHVSSLFRSNRRVLEACQASRSPLSLTPEGESIPLKKYASMGNATIFPIQSFFFLCCCLAAVTAKRRIGLGSKPWRRFEKEIRVFGDDIVVPSDSGPLLCSLLESFGLKVNHDKSYLTGFFRESCGKDYYHGWDVSPVYLKEGYNKRKPESVASYVNLHNNLLKRGLFNAAREVAALLPHRVTCYREPIDSGNFGLWSYVRASDRRKRRFNSTLQRWEVRSPTMISRQRTKPVQGSNQALLRFFSEFNGLDPWSAVVKQKPYTQLRDKWIPDHLSTGSSRASSHG